MGDCHNDMEIGKPFDQLTAACLHPFLRFRSLAGGAAAVPAGGIVDLPVSALGTDIFRKTKKAGLALHDAPGSAFLFRSNCMPGAEIRIEQPECITDQIISHRIISPCPAGW